MAQPMILEEYVVKLGMHGPSESDRRDIVRAFDALQQAAAAIVGPLTAAITAIGLAVEPIANGLSKLFFEASRIGTTVEHIQELKFAVSQFGGSAEQVAGELAGFAQTLKAQPNIKGSFKSWFPGLTDKDLEDPEAAFAKIAKQLAVMRANKATRQRAMSLEGQTGISDATILAFGSPGFDDVVAKEARRIAGMNEFAANAVKVTQAFQNLSAAISTVISKAEAQLFGPYAQTLDSLSAWIDANQPKLIELATDVGDQFKLAFDELSTIGGPLFRGLSTGFNDISTVLDRLMGNPDGKHGGIHALHYALDALAIYIAGSAAWKLLAAIGVTLRGLGPLGLAGAAAYGVLSNVPKAEGDDSYGIDHPGWHPGMPKEKTRHQKDVEAGAAVAPGDSAAPHPAYYHGTLQVGKETFHYGTGSPDRGRGSSAFGDHPITGWDPAAHYGVGGGAFRIEDQNDPNVPGGPRQQVEIHEGQTDDLDHLYTAGCFAVPPSEWPRAKAAIMDQLRSGNTVLRIGKDGNASVVPAGTPNVSAKPDKTSFLAGAHAAMAALVAHPHALQNLAALTDNSRTVVRGGLSRDAGTKIHNIKVVINSTDPHAAASEVARHMKDIHLGMTKAWGTA